MKFEGWEGNGFDVEATDAPSLEDLYSGNIEQEIEEIPEKKQEVPKQEKKKETEKKQEQPKEEELEEEKEEEQVPPTMEELFGETEKQEEENSSVDISALLKATALYKAEKYGLDVSEVEEWTEEAFAALEDEIDNIRLEEKWEQAKETSEFTRDIVRIAEAGGDVRDILSLFSEQQDLSEIDTNSPAGMTEYIKKFYLNVDGKDANWVNKYLNRMGVAEDPEALQEEFTSVKEKYDEFFAQEKENRIKQAEEQTKQAQLAQQKRQKDFSEIVGKKISGKKEARELQDYVFQGKYQPRGTNQVISEFDKDLRESRKDANKMFELAMFLKNPEEFKQRIVTEANSKKNDSVFGSILKKNVESPVQQQESVPKRKFQFKLE